MLQYRVVTNNSGMQFHPSHADMSSGSKKRRWAWLARVSFASVAPIAEFATRFLRTIILSRLLSPAEFGTSVALSVVVGTAMMISDIGLDRFILLKSGDESRRALAAAQTIQLMRGLLLAASMLAAARPAAEFFDVPQAERSFLWLAVIPVVHVCAHLGPKQAHSSYDFRQDAWANIAASAASLVAAGAAVLCVARDHNAILVSLISAEVAYVCATHILSRQKFTMAWDSQIMLEALRYGLPLTLNGVGLAILAQADRMLVGATFGVEILGTYAVIVSIAIATMSPIYATFSSVALVTVARNRPNSRRFPDLFTAVVWGFGLLGFAHCAFIGLSLDLIVPKIFGDRYVVEPGVRIALATIAFIRVMRGPPSVLLLVDGGTGRLTASNLVAGIGLGVAIVSVQAVPTLDAVLIGMLVGDLLSLLLFQLFQFRQVPDFGLRLLRVLALQCAAALALSGALVSALGTEPGGRMLIALAASCIIALMGIRALSFSGGGTV